MAVFTMKEDHAVPDRITARPALVRSEMGAPKKRTNDR